MKNVDVVDKNAKIYLREYKIYRDVHYTGIPTSDVAVKLDQF